MSLRTIASLAVAVVLGLIAVAIVRGLIGGQGSAGPIQAGMAQVVVASTEIKRGTALQPAMFRVAQYPRDSVPQGGFTAVSQIVIANAPPRVALQPMVANEPVVASKISGFGASGNLSGQLKPGMRAIAMRSSDVAGVGGFVLPGDRVDVLGARAVGEGEQEQKVVQVLADNVRVLGVDQSADAEKPTVAKAVTVEVTPDQAQAISLAQAVGEVSLALRQSADEAPLTRRMTTVADLGGVVRPAPTRISTVVRRPARPAPPQVRVTRGVEVSGYPVPY